MKLQGMQGKGINFPLQKVSLEFSESIGCCKEIWQSNKMQKIFLSLSNHDLLTFWVKELFYEYTR